MLLPDAITLPLLWIGLLWSASGGFVPLTDAVWGAAVGYLSLWPVYWAYKLATGKEGFGYGDFKLLAALGAWFGWQAILPVVLLSAVVGATVGIALVVGGPQDDGVEAAVRRVPRAGRRADAVRGPAGDRARAAEPIAE